ncbi:MAG: NUDIX domain-containing protein [Bacteroidetes bacterium]|nr:NUDIX domain-containing protein [Bacteroidota bacterium]MBU1371654.1 NUDIX domain-containing protein [Bacteroidota bacterium]MBU1486230.1 NUDIX domain-containing protein [Bacteroidota bacterium]MBU1761933.1 NUDIX domain-containing protein [Bacteroidota bacterium]MBU2267483.1 NUDIX domain-containing protein [Bacteroidota bacterium]
MERPKFNVRVYGILINDRQEVLLSDEEEHGKQFIKFPGGGLELGEGLIDGLKREFIEECDLSIEILKHFYTTDFFIESAFGGGQLISIYYLVKPLQEINFKISKYEYDFGGQTGSSKQCFRFVPLEALQNESVTFPVDQHVVKLLKSNYL